MTDMRELPLNSGISRLNPKRTVNAIFQILFFCIVLPIEHYFSVQASMKKLKRYKRVLELKFDLEKEPHNGRAG